MIAPDGSVDVEVRLPQWASAFVDVGVTDGHGRPMFGHPRPYKSPEPFHREAQEGMNATVTGE